MNRSLVGPGEVREAAACDGILRIPCNAILSPYAEDEALKLGVRIERVDAVVVALGADHGGFELKGIIKVNLESCGKKVLDLGTHSKDPVDYPDVAVRVARAVVDGAARAGILVDGAGIGSSMAANKVRGIRAAKCDSLFDAKNAREHNHANILTLGARLEPKLACEMVAVWLQTPFGGGRHKRRVEKIMRIEGMRR